MLCIADVSVGDKYLSVTLDDNRTMLVPISWFPRLYAASEGERQMWKIFHCGQGIRWDSIDEDVSVKNLFSFEAKPSSEKLNCKCTSACASRVPKVDPYDLD